MKLKQLMPRQNVFNVNIRRRVPFSHDEVVADWGIQGAGLPHFSARLYEEVRLLNEAIRNYHAKTSLEVGCGYGRLTPWIVEQSDRHYAIDPEPALLNDAVKLYPNVHFHQASAQELPFPDNHFDLCVSWTVLQHIPSKELVRAVSEIRRVCMPEAVIILAEGVGKFVSGQGYWEHDLEVWKRLLFPWKLTWLKERKLEKSSKGVGHGLVMRFER